MQKRKKNCFLAAMMASVLLGAAEVSAEPEQAAQIEEVSTHTETFVEDHSMYGLFSQCTEYFQAEDWEIRDAKFVMVYNVTELRDEKISDFTVSLNGEPFHSGRFLEAGEEKQTLELAIPVRLIKEGTNELKIESYVRTRDSLPCVDDVSKANWFQVFKESAIHISYTQDKSVENIADIYSKMTGIYAMENQKAAVIIPDAATDVTMSAAANILTGISKNAKMDYDNLKLVTSDRVFLAEDAEALDWGVYVGEWDFLPEQVKDVVSQEAKKEIQEGGAVLDLVSWKNRNLLLLTGMDEEKLKKGSVMFGNADYMKQMVRKFHVITEEENSLMEKKEPLEYSDLTADGVYADGAFRQTFSFSQSAYANKTLSPKSQIYLKMRYAKNIDFDRSLLTVYVNDVPIGSHKLSAEKADEDEAEFYIPADMQVSGDFTVKAAFDLEIEDLWCTLRQGETPWAYVSPESMMKMIVAEEVPLLFQHYPAPFIKTKSLDDVLIALPETPAGEDIQAMRGICLTLGRFLEDNTGAIAVKQGASEEDCRGKNVIAIGTYQANALIQENNKKLYFKFSEDGAALLTNEKKRITKEAGADMGTLQLLNAPWDENRGMLVVTGPTPEAMAEAAEYLSDTQKLWKLEGDGCVTDGEEAETYQFKETSKNRIRTQKEFLERDDVLRFLIISIAVAVVLLIGLLFILAKYVRRGKRKGSHAQRKENR